MRWPRFVAKRQSLFSRNKLSTCFFSFFSVKETRHFCFLPFAPTSERLGAKIISWTSVVSGKNTWFDFMPALLLPCCFSSCVFFIGHALFWSFWLAPKIGKPMLTGTIQSKTILKKENNALDNML